jgi:3-oxoacyl-[acyl-carrier protein] reductase
MDLEIKDRRALVTGGSKGIGLGVARRLAAEGCDLVLVARSGAELDHAAEGIRAETGRAVAVLPIDLSERGAAARIVAAHPDIDILVNNAGAIPTGTLEEISDQAMRESWDVKVFGYIDLCRHYMPRMRKRKDGVILNIIGVAGEALDAKYIAGSVGNAALIAFTKALGSTSIGDGVRVVGVNPGPVLTERLMDRMRKRATERFGDADRWPEIASTMPGGRAAHVDEVAATAALLCSSLSSYTSGAVINIDGGISNRR